MVNVGSAMIVSLSFRLDLARNCIVEPEHGSLTPDRPSLLLVREAVIRAYGVRWMRGYLGDFVCKFKPSPVALDVTRMRPDHGLRLGQPAARASR